MATLARNKRATFDYELLEEFEGGLVLSGIEVRSIRTGRMQLEGSFLLIERGELWLKNAFIAPYAPAGSRLDSYDPNASRKVLVHKKQLSRLLGKTQADRLTLVPISVYTKGPLLKIRFALAKGKKTHEKRDTIKKREVDRMIRNRMKT